MKVSIKGGSKNMEKEITTGQYSGMAKAIRTSSSIVAKGVKSKEKSPAIKENNDQVIEEKKNANAKVEKEVASKTPEKKEVISPIEFDKSLIKNNDSTVEKFNKVLREALDILESADENEKEEISDIIAEAFADEIEAAARKVFKDQIGDSGEVSPDKIIMFIMKASNMLSEFGLNNMYEFFDDEKRKEFVDDISSDFVRFFLNAIIGSRFYSHANHGSMYYSENDGIVIYEIFPGIMESIGDSIEDDRWVFLDEEPTQFGIEKNMFLNIAESAGYKLIDNNSDTNNGQYGSCKYYAGKVINVKDLFADQQSGKIIVLIDDAGKYMTTGPDNDIVAVDVIDSKSVDSLSIVSAQWLSGVMKEREENQEEEEEESVENKSEGIPTGVLPPSMAVNGVAESSSEVEDEEGE